MIRELASAIKVSYRMAFNLFVGATWLWLGAAFFEMLQHAVEWQLGMFTPGDGIDPDSEFETRMVFGYLKVAAVLVCAYLVPRFLYLNRDWKQVLQGDIRLLGGVVVVFGTFGLGLAPAEILYLMEARVDVIGSEFETLWIELAGFVLTIPLAALYPWGIGLIAGDRSMTFRKSISAMHGYWIWALLLFLCCTVPALVPHFLLNDFAYGASPAIMGSLLLLDSVLVGLIALLLGCVNWTIYRFRVLNSLTGDHVERGRANEAGRTISSP